MTQGLNEIFARALIDINNNGLETNPRNQKSKELLAYSLTLNNPRNRIITYDSRNTSYRYLLAELIWYLSGSNLADPISKYAPFWSQIKNPDNKTVNSAYGFRIFGKAKFIPYNQWDKVKEILRKDPDSRQAIIHINQPIDYTYNNKDVPCTLTLQFFIRENQLHLDVNMRSNDIILGFTNDVFQFTMLQEIMQVQLSQEEQFKDLELGKYYHKAGSMHIYERHYKMMSEIISEYNVNCEKTQRKFMELNFISNTEERIQIAHEICHNDHPMIPMEFDDDTISNLIKLERDWRKNGCSKTFDFSKKKYFKDLPEYWQRLVKTCFNELFFETQGDMIVDIYSPKIIEVA